MKELKKQIFNDIWFLYKRHLQAITDEDWEAVLIEEKALRSRHGNDPLLDDLIYAINNELGRK